MEHSRCTVKIDRIGRSVQSSGGALLGAYGLIYAISSEIIHGSVYGMSYFMSAHNPGDMTVEGFQNGTESQVVTILTAVSHAASGFLSAFWQLHQCRPAIDAERSLLNAFSRLSSVATSPLRLHRRKMELRIGGSVTA